MPKKKSSLNGGTVFRLFARLGEPRSNNYFMTPPPLLASRSLRPELSQHGVLAEIGPSMINSKILNPQLRNPFRQIRPIKDQMFLATINREA